MIHVSRSHPARNVAGLGAVVLFVVISATGATAQVYPPEVIKHCIRMASKMPGTSCTTCGEYRDYYEHACEANGGRIPGSQTFDNRPFDSGPTEEDRY
jgi:hypothetical protein